MNKKTDDKILDFLINLERHTQMLEEEFKFNLQRLNFIRREIKKFLSNVEKENINHDSNMVNRFLTPIISPKFTDSENFYFINGVKIRKNTIKDYVIQILFDSNDGFTAWDILTKMNERYDTYYSRESLSPQLSRLKHDGVITLNDTVWKLVRNEPNDSI